MNQLYARVIIDISHEKVDRPFCYKVPEHLMEQAEVGACVKVPFGQWNTLRKGYVIERMETPDFDPDLIKEIRDVETGVQVENKLIKLAYWIREEYGSTMIQALQTVLPVKQKIKQKEKRILIRKCTKEEAKIQLEICEKKHQAAKARVLNALVEDEQIPYALLTSKLHVSASTINSLKKAEIVEEVSELTYRNPIKGQEVSKERKVLSNSQQQIVDDIWKDYENGIRKTYLIHGITGSGKTEVYMALIEKVIGEGKAVIMLIPEIALTFQTVMRFQRRFGDRVSVLNSTLSQGEKYDQCERAKKRKIDIIIGPRSALFTPFENIGLILIDEEHENTYKSESMPKYHARETAEELARLHGASVVLGSATPSMESYYKAMSGVYGFFTLKERLTGGMLPKVYIEDLREELKGIEIGLFLYNIDNYKEKISEISEAEHIPILSKLQSLLFLPGFVDKDAFGLWNSLHNAFRKIAHNDYNEVKKHLENSLQHCDLSDEERCFCNSILEEILRDQNTANDIAWNMDEVIGFLNQK